MASNISGSKKVNTTKMIQKSYVCKFISLNRLKSINCSGGHAARCIWQKYLIQTKNCSKINGCQFLFVEKYFNQRMFEQFLVQSLRQSSRTAPLLPNVYDYKIMNINQILLKKWSMQAFFLPECFIAHCCWRLLGWQQQIYYGYFQTRCVIGTLKYKGRIENISIPQKYTRNCNK